MKVLKEIIQRREEICNHRRILNNFFNNITQKSYTICQFLHCAIYIGYFLYYHYFSLVTGDTNFVQTHPFNVFKIFADIIFSLRALRVLRNQI